MKKVILAAVAALTMTLTTGCDSKEIQQSMASAIDGTANFVEGVYDQTDLKRQHENEARSQQRRERRQNENDERHERIMQYHR